MLEKIVTLMKSNRERMQERLVARIIESIPRYAMSIGDELRKNVETLARDLFVALETGDDKALLDRLVAISHQRAKQGFRVSDYVLAILTLFPVLREVVRETSRASDAEFAGEFDQLEMRLFGLAGNAAEIFARNLLRQLEAKNQALNRLNQQLAVQERTEASKADQASRELRAANEFNQRVIASLTAGLTVIDAKTLKITMYTSRMEEITGIPAEEALGLEAVEVFRRLEGLDPAELIQTVQARGRLPLTKLRLHRQDGKAIAVLVRAERMWDSRGNPEGTVVIVDDVSERELLLDSFSRYVSRDLVRRVLARAEPLDLGGERHTCTVLFVDIRGFTGLAEALDPDQLHELLNTYFRVVIDVINARGGFIDKFIGDNVMAIFDWRTPPQDAAQAALLAAGDIVSRIQALNDERQAQELLPIEVGVGVNTGEVLLGNVGSEERMDFTAIGDPVNVAARLQSLAPPGRVLLGKATADLVAERMAVTSQGVQQLRGRQQTEEVFELQMEP